MTSPEARPARSGPRPWWHRPLIGLGALVSIVMLLLAFNWSHLSKQAELGARYTARVACSCRYVEGRDLASCETDREPGTEIVSLRDDPPAERVFASVPFLAEAAAEKRGRFGCVLMTPTELDTVD